MGKTERSEQTCQVFRHMLNLLFMKKAFLPQFIKNKFLFFAFPRRALLLLLSVSPDT